MSSGSVRPDAAAAEPGSPLGAEPGSPLGAEPAAHGDAKPHWSRNFEISDLVNVHEFDFDRVAGSLLDAALGALGAQRGLLVVQDSSGAQKLAAISGLDRAGLELPAPDGPLDAFAQKLGATAFLACPLVKHIGGDPSQGTGSGRERRRFALPPMERTLGWIYVDRGTEESAFDDEDRRRLASLAEHGATILVKSRLFEMATLDPITGFLVRGQLDHTLGVELRLAENSSQPLAVLMIDVDHFKSISEALGFRGGEIVLGRVAEVIREALRREDICVRYGGEDFLVVLPNTDRGGARTVAEGLRSKVESADCDPRGVPVTISIGIAVYPFHTYSSEELVKKADQALYEAKEEGRNRFCMWSEKLSTYSLRTDRLQGIITGDQARDYHNVMTLLDSTAAINSTLALDDLLSVVMDMMIDVSNAERGILLLADDGVQLTTRLAQDKFRNRLEAPVFATQIPEKVFRTGNPICFVDSRTDPNRPNPERMRSVMCVPIFQEDKPVGVMYVDSHSHTRQFGEADLSFFQALAHNVGIALEKAKLYAELEKRGKELERLNAQLQERVDEQEKELVEVRQVLEENISELSGRYKYDNLVGKSEAMREIYRLLDRITDAAVPVLIQGESGTGKELVAKAIHYNSPRRDRRFVSINCAAISESLLESELFGHMKGAFTGADHDKKGLFELADKGTLFMDEVGDMSEGMQRKLLRVLQEGEVRAVGGKDVVKVNVRVISATHQDLKAMVELGTFRKDLYYRLNVVNFNLPGLRERKEDIPLLVERFLDDMAERDGARVHVDKKAMLKLQQYHWPGNVRELKNYIERAVLMCEGGMIQEKDVQFDQAAEGVGPSSDYYLMPYKDAKDAYLKDYLLAALTRNSGNVTRAAKESGMVRSSFHKVMRKYGINSDDARNS